MDLESLAAFLIFSLLMIIAAQGWTWLIVVFAFLPTFLITYYVKKGSKVRTRFFLSWAVVSFFFVLGVFELEVVPYLEILFYENFSLMCMVSCMCACLYFAKARQEPSTTDSPNGRILDVMKKTTKCEMCSLQQPPRAAHCDLCGVCILKRDHHSVWIDTCIGSKNQTFYLGAILALFVSCIYSSSLTLTTICHPTLVWGNILMPDDCSDVFGDFHIAICFVSAIYTLEIAAFAVFLAINQVLLIALNMTTQEWAQGQAGLYHNGVGRNILDFLHGAA